MTTQKISLRPPQYNIRTLTNVLSHPGYQPAQEQWAEDMTEMMKLYLSGEPVYVELVNIKKRIGSIGVLVINNVQDILSGERRFLRPQFRYDRQSGIKEIPANVTPSLFLEGALFSCSVRWEGRKNVLNYVSSDEILWLKGRTKEEGSVWVYETPKEEQVIPRDRLGREIKVGDFISYILYYFQGSNAAGIYYGKVTKIDVGGTVWAKNIKLNETDKSDEKRIKDNNLIVIMTSDLMDQLMLA